MSQFAAGKPRHPNAGRKKGSLNKLKKVADILAANDIDPVKEILAIIKSEESDKKISEGLKLDAWFQLLAYCHAKPKEIEIDEDSDPSDDLAETPTESLIKLVKAHNEAS